MSQPVCRMGDLCDHGSSAIEYSPNVFVNGKPVVRLGDAFQPHTIGRSSHNPVVIQGSATVFVNGKPVARLGDALNCGAVISEGSPSVFVG